MINYDALCCGFAFVIGSLFFIAALGMSGDQYRISRRSPKYPPGYKNNKKY
jgi:hypothetical protein